ncbi:enoyl-CoA hydratase [Aquabacterium fontiphilum]|jgi:enoyl-CoA hydratase/carnithine racemase|uniref:oxepin-CoA hydrolase, alternative type n=1 Tax=Aquabacterium fontiphilum TaxID=450365 RepID=UPI001376B8DF|nr:enoyl-CoA hydratase family protein [Aquabacterium fontiphilum]NBD21860.1 enoyl-CoA hydratase [Aquabacterium fontiphilum]
MTTELLTHTLGQTLVMTLNGPATRNALSTQVYAAGVESLNMAESNPDVRAVVITGAGGHFCSGGDVQRLRHNRQHDLAGQSDAVQAFHEWILALRAFPKPVVAAVEGHAAGGGVSLALACDLIVAANDARFSLSYMRVGLSPDGGISQALVQALGRRRAFAALALAETHDASLWAQCGLVQQLSEPGQALHDAVALADRLAAQPAGALASLKELIHDAMPVSPDHLQAERTQFMRNLVSPEAGQAMDAFLSRRQAS